MRSLNLKANKYQTKIIWLVFLPTILIFLLTALFLVVFYHELIEVTLYQSRASIVEFIIEWRGYVLMGLSFLIVGVLVAAFTISSRLVGAFERIIRELDEVLEGKKKGPLTARDHDLLANELLKRINRLLDK